MTNQRLVSSIGFTQGEDGVTPTALDTRAKTELREMRCESVPNCDLCGASGTVIHEGLYDHLKGVAGIFSYRRCNNPACGTLWLDPRPTLEDIHLAYQVYYTHKTYRASVQRSWKRILLDLWTGTLGVTKERELLETLYLSENTPGKVLDIGCGNGGRLARLRSLGWQPQGQEVDTSSAAVAERDLGIPVFVGPIEDAPFPADSFDAVISNHVLEHVHDPEAILRTAWRMLSPGGELVFVMPNAFGSLHSHFRDNWVNLDPPRHLRLFTPLSLVAVAHRAGIEQPIVTTTAAHSEALVRGSIQVARHRGVSETTTRGYWTLHSTPLYATIAILRHRLDPLSGEELILRARKPIA